MKESGARGKSLMRAGVWVIAACAVYWGAGTLSLWSWRHDLAGQSRPSANRYLTPSRRQWMSARGIEVLNYMKGPKGAFVSPIFSNGAEFMVKVRPVAGVRHMIVRCPTRSSACNVFVKAYPDGHDISGKAVKSLIEESFSILHEAASAGDFPSNG